MTLEEFLRLRERKPALEYIGGEVTQKVSPKLKHGALQAETMLLIDSYARPRRLARAFPETRATFAGRSLVPDVSVFRWVRIPTTPSGDLVDDVVIPPDIAIEIISPGQTVTNPRERCRWFVQHGVHIVLLVIPTRRVVHRFDEHGREAELTGDDRIDLDDVLPDFRLTDNELFAALAMV